MSDLSRISEYTELVGFEDELYYSELKRQILQLTADDNEDEGEFKHLNSLPPGTGRASASRRPFVAMAGVSAANWVTISSRVKSSGTGVFIPHAVKSRTRNPSGRMGNNDRRRTYHSYRQAAKH
ncbi:hypothetical protein SAY87_020111 [Trapa incisa]|uniref:Uncharacterized protein n=1 Tax=Trapa incisa TaxID=236973 RepID=A0AAN7Q8B1_9MYRT|nr:hypothetical protein SAY87_020111 [Trapa incisa]